MSLAVAASVDGGSWLYVYGNVVLMLAVVPANLFPLFYLRSAWYISPIGRALMTKACGLAALIDVSLLYMVFGSDYTGRDLVRAVVFSLVVFGMYYQFGALLRIQHASRRDRPKGGLRTRHAEQEPVLHPEREDDR